MDNAITLQAVSIAAPVAVSNVHVTVAANVFSNVDTQTETSARNATLAGHLVQGEQMGLPQLPIKCHPLIPRSLLLWEAAVSHSQVALFRTRVFP